MRSPRLVTLLGCAALTALASDSRALTHVVQKGDTLASIAERYYGLIQHEKLLVAANGLEARGGVAIALGMRLEVPALSHRRVKKTDTWADLATQLLGAPHRADVLSMANGSSPWLPPADGAEIAVPYNLPVMVTNADSIVSIAQKYLGDPNKAWVLDHYNGLKSKKLAPGDIVLVPLTELPLTDDGKKAVADSNPLVCSQAAGDTRERQRKVQAELPALNADVKAGRYVDAVARGNRFLSASAQLTTEQLASVHRQLLEAYAALDAPGLARAACAEWKRLDGKVVLDPVTMSPKLRDACVEPTP
ncbi:MAG: LysM peptidoglycan-binding domain-containing protein [Polyangiaceae bacterium]|nr:LysM peptidoglycan-binding domain-containing protein [Myxococcales bacterium]MCC6899334.1 LysM peptidoglycan-binding domain-containing protein [Polyangiaceae bacterium]